MMQLSVFNPTTIPASADVDAAPPAVVQALSSLRGKVVGIIDNSKPNFEHLASALEKLLVGEHGVAQVLRHRKHAASLPARPGVCADFAARCDLVLTGSGD